MRKKPRKKFTIFSKFFKKPIDNEKYCDIILKCIIMSFTLWGYFALFSGRFKHIAQKKQGIICAFVAKCCTKSLLLVNFQEWSDSIYDA
jgi:hypothetical protein